ncbi:hypothetical protein L209DRAFT_743055 [Thermothelomyces heterothallicus CBS 203.75]
MNDFLKCAAAATAFLRASVKLKAAADLNKFPRTVDGLNKFFERPGDDGVFLASLFPDHYNHKTLKPITTVPTSKVAGVGPVQARSKAREARVSGCSNGIEVDEDRYFRAVQKKSNSSKAVTAMVRPRVKPHTNR